LNKFKPTDKKVLASHFIVYSSLFSVAAEAQDLTVEASPDMVENEEQLISGGNEMRGEKDGRCHGYATAKR